MKCTWGSGDSPREHTTALKGFVSSQATEVPHSTQQEEENVAFSALVGQSMPMQWERREDIPLLLRAFFTQYQTESGQLLPEVSAAALQCLAAYAWPGNIRELKNAIEYALIRCKDGLIRSDDLPPEIQEALPFPHAQGRVEGESRASDETARILSL